MEFRDARARSPGRARGTGSTMVLVAAADGGMTDREIGVMAGQVQTLPVFHDFTTEQLGTVTDAAVRLLNEDDGLQHAARLMRGALEPRLRETAYALACEVVAASQVREPADTGDAGLRPRRTAARPADRRRDRARRARPPSTRRAEQVGMRDAGSCGGRRRGPGAGIDRCWPRWAGRRSGPPCSASARR